MIVKKIEWTDIFAANCYFYVDEKTKIVNFDLVISFDDKEPEMTIKNITDKMKEHFPDYEFFANLDRDI